MSAQTITDRLTGKYVENRGCDEFFCNKNVALSNFQKVLRNKIAYEKIRIPIGKLIACQTSVK